MGTTPSDDPSGQGENLKFVSKIQFAKKCQNHPKYKMEGHGELGGQNQPTTLRGSEAKIKVRHLGRNLIA